MTSRALLVFADDWGRHPSSCQHLVRRLLDQHPVWWVNTIGTRKPSFDLTTLRRGVEKLHQWFRAKPPQGEGEPANPRVLNPRMWPMFSTRLDRWLNRSLLLRQLGPVVQAIPQKVTAITTIPLVAELMGRLPVERWVYYCVDDFSTWPGLDHRTIRRMEDELLARADIVVAVSETLQDNLRKRGRESHLLTHGVELDFWNSPALAGPVPELAALERPLLAFWGLVDRRMDVAVVRRIAADLKQGTLVLVGPESDPDPVLSTIPRVVRVPPLGFEQLPGVAREASILVMPYADLPVTRAIQPLKLKEYLSTGKPTVVRDLPATRPWADCLDLADSPESFSRAVQMRLASGIPVDQVEARIRLKDESWEKKAEQFTRWVLEPA